MNKEKAGVASKRLEGLKNKEVVCLLKKAKRVLGKQLVFYVSRNWLKSLRLAISIPRKNIKLSAKRNLIRRRIKNCFYGAINKKDLSGLDVLVVAKSKEPLSFEQIRKEILFLIKKIN